MQLSTPRCLQYSSDKYVHAHILLVITLFAPLALSPTVGPVTVTLSALLGSVILVAHRLVSHIMQQSLEDDRLLVYC
jgi:hypothetical protein